MLTFEQWLSSFEWLNERNRQCIVSADLDGVACSILQGSRLDWKTVGVYDGSKLGLYLNIDEVDWDSVVFLDVEILRPGIHSIGNHLLTNEEQDVQDLRNSYPRCANPNLWRKITVADNFQKKYPFSTLPLLLAAHCVNDHAFQVSRIWLALTLHTYSSFTNAAKYQENALEWLEAMQCINNESKFAKICPPYGLSKFCRILKRLPAQIAMSLVNSVHECASESGFGKNQRACRFDSTNEKDRIKIGTLSNRICGKIDFSGNLPFEKKPTEVLEFSVEKKPIDAKGRARNSFLFAKNRRALSMAATGRTKEGLSMTLPDNRCPVEMLR